MRRVVEAQTALQPPDAFHDRGSLLEEGGPSQCQDRRPDRAIEQIDAACFLELDDGLRNGRLRKAEFLGRRTHAARFGNRNEDRKPMQIDLVAKQSVRR
ncbi:hypothetical protein [Paraburkholderia sp. Cy-641]|uniref:hypothetical protein n=1 Tax=Paraburkholderia sp. Cy-641 TaxID=2608337 RepID=UPI001F04FB25|nr:hypothetical protein [Paraburkholderia sp. Cy-641]